MNSKLAGILSVLALVGLAPVTGARAQAGPDVSEKAAQCAACHGENGVPVDKSIPVIWGQNQGYLYINLRDFKLGQRKNETMNEMTKDMSRDEMMALAEYFSAKRWPGLNHPRSIAADTRRAESAIVAGQCGACHGEQGLGNGTQPRIAGQQHDYLLQTMQDFRTRKRANNPWMSDILNTLAPEDLEALANDFAGR